MTLTKRNIEALIAARDKGGAIYLRGTRAGGAKRRMCERLAIEGLVHEYPPFPITEKGLRALSEIQTTKA